MHLIVIKNTISGSTKLFMRKLKNDKRFKNLLN